MASLDDLARSYGIALQLPRPDGGVTLVPDATKRAILAALGVSEDAQPPAEPESTEGIASCFLPQWLEENPSWGISVQLYELRSQRNWGMGDFADLAAFSRIAAEAGADFVGLNPLHALFLASPARCSPFSPSNRRFLNPLYIAVDQVPGYRADADRDQEAARLRDAPLVDYEGVAALKLAALRDIWRSDATLIDENFAAFCAEGGEPLRMHALFEALSLDLAAAGHGAGWTNWPEAFRDAKGPTVAAYAADHEDAVRFHLWLQWLAHSQLDAAGAAARDAGMRIGLFLDLAVGDAPDGSATWSDPSLYAKGLSIGAPPDMFSEIGQDWALAPLSPTALAQRNLAPYRDMLAANMRSAGVLRMDHVMALRQLFLVPRDGTAAAGAHVRYPFEAMVAALAEASHRYRAICIGEDLGFVPPGFRETMAQAHILAYRPLYFEKRGDSFAPARDYPRLALACLSTHDLPTLFGWWQGGDIALREQNGLITHEAAAWQTAERARERQALIDACREAGTLASDAAAGEPLTEALVVATHRFVARTPSRLAVSRLVDLVGGTEATNVPGTVETYPNWRPKVPCALEDLHASPLFKATTRAMSEERPRR